MDPHKQAELLPTEVLRQEHEVIRAVLTALERTGQQLAQGAAIDAAFWHDAIEFLRVFADLCHHAKEEGHLFPALADAGLAERGGPVGQLLGEHESARALVLGLADARAAGDAQALVQLTRRYVALLRDHISKENEVLFVLAERVLAPATMGRILEGFALVEHDELNEDTHGYYLRLAGDLCRRAGVAADLPRGGCGCGGHGQCRQS